MKVRLKPQETIQQLNPEQRLTDLPLIEAIYQIRILKALTASLMSGFIEVAKEKQGAVYSDEFDIWLEHYEHID